MRMQLWFIIVTAMLSSFIVKKASALRRLPSVYKLQSAHQPSFPWRSTSALRSFSKDSDAKAAKKYSKTVLLPVTSFDQRANSVVKEPKLQRWWKENQIYEKLSTSNAGGTFTLHDGPPYANGNLHIGHALNKILKDFVNKYQTLQGKKVRYVPGWDCHGLPIELKVLQEISTAERATLTPIQLRKRALQFAKDAMDGQREAFKRYGVWGEWDTPYMTAQPAYEAAQIRVFGEMVSKGHIYRGKKPVHWSPSSRTALAEAELEYPGNHVSRSIYVGFKVTKPSNKLREALGTNQDVRLAIWTTTPWTIPANLAVAVHGELEYCLASHPSVANGAHFLVGLPLVNALSAKLGLDVKAGEALKVTKVLRGEDLVGSQYQHPLYDRTSEVVLGGDYINMESGTGLVHTAPGHGQEDYLTGLKYNLPLLSPVNDLGQFTDEAGERFAGLNVLKEGNQAVISALQEAGSLIKEEAYKHKYPYDWRSKQPTIFRATEQWFASVSTFREEAMAAIESVEWIPALGQNRISAMTQSRGDWCISRQRAWGVPIPVFYKTSTNEPLMTPETLAHIEKVFSEHGSDAWWAMDTASLLPPGALRDRASEYTKGSDTMDVWFDSGTSWAGVLQASATAKDGKGALNYPADMYLEGSDQHRGWFQSSLLTSVASKGVAPYKTVLTHGFVLDEKGYKMSKSLGNVVDPQQVILGGANQTQSPAYGADTLRLWVSGVDYAGDVCLGNNIMKQVSESSRKIRNTMRYLLGSVNDFDPALHRVPYDQMSSLDKYTLGRLSAMVQEVQDGYNSYQFNKANRALIQFATSDLSAFYLDIAKDRLYISSKDDARRRSCQTVIATVLEQLSVAMAPILSHMAEEVWQSIPYQKPALSVFQRGWVRESEVFPPCEEDRWDKLKSLRGDVNTVIEGARKAKQVGAAMECSVYLHASDPQWAASLAQLNLGDAFADSSVRKLGSSTNTVDDLRFLLMVSQVHLVDSADAVAAACPQHLLTADQTESKVTIGVAKAAGKKCQRCWYYSDTVGHDHVHGEVCLRCAEVVKTDKYVVDE